MSKATATRIEMADAHAKSAMKALSALQAERGLDVTFQRAVCAALESNIELIRFIGQVRVQLEPVAIREDKL